MHEKTLFTTQITDAGVTTDKEGVGRLRWVNNKSCYRWVYNNTGSTLAAGNVLCHGTAGFALTTGATPTTLFEEVFQLGQSSKGTVAGLIAGVVPVGVAASTWLTATYGWIQIFGYHSAVNWDAQAGGGNAIAVGSNLKINSATFNAIIDTAVGTAATVRRGITALAALASGTGNGVSLIDCLH